jgi:hypothetical protein
VIHAFSAMGGVAREIAYDNLATAVAEHDGRLVRFLPRFLAFEQRVVRTDLRCPISVSAVKLVIRCRWWLS